MNPLLLKPTSDHTSQVVLNGKPIGNRSAYAYFRTEGRDELRREVNQAFDRLAARYNPVVMEGAGSISEINLKDTDLVNLPMARHAHADVILVADIDRGGVFAVPTVRWPCRRRKTASASRESLSISFVATFACLSRV